MDRPSVISMEERGVEQQPAMDGLPCYMCAINDLENCTHVKRVTNDASANSIAPIHQGDRLPPPSYNSATSPEQASRDTVPNASSDQVDIVLEYLQGVGANSDSNRVAESDEVPRKSVCLSRLYTAVSFGIFMLIFWVIFRILR